MVAPTSDPNRPNADPLEQAGTQNPTGMGSHGWSRIVIGAILLGALVTVIIRGIYVVTHLDDNHTNTVQTDAP